MRQAYIKAVIFDYGSVLARTLDPTPRATWERRLGLASGALQHVVHNDHSWVAAQLGQLHIDAYWHEVGRHLGLTAVDTARLRATFYTGDALNVELIARIDHLRVTGIRTALLSNFSSELRQFLADFDLLRRFESIAISAEIGVMKPDLAAYQHVLARLGLPGQECIFIDDQPTNVRAAQTLGIHGIVFRDNASCLAALDRLCTAPG